MQSALIRVANNSITRLHASHEPCQQTTYQSLGRKQRGLARAKKLSKKRRSEIARMGALAANKRRKEI